jgi:hypothetical protein
LKSRQQQKKVGNYKYILIMAQSFYGSIDFSKLLEQAKAGSKAFTKSEKNGKIYLNIDVYVKDEVDQYGNIASIRGTFKGAEKDDKFYFANLKESQNNGSAPIQSEEIPDLDSLPF